MKEIPIHPNAINLCHEVLVNTGTRNAFAYIINNFSENYPKFAKGHQYFNIENGKRIEVGAVIECAETAGIQSINHRYIVADIIENQRICFESKPSHVTIPIPGRVIKSTSNTYVYYDVENRGDTQTIIRLTITIQFKHALEKLFSQLTGGMIPWKNHCIEELEGLRKLIIEEKERWHEVDQSPPTADSAD